MTRVLIVEDSPLVASGMRATLTGHAEVQVVGEVASVAEATVALREHPIDVAVVDVRLSDGTAFDLLRKVHDLDPHPAFLIVSSFDLAQYVDAALHLGASGYLLKTAPTAEIVRAVLTVADGGWAFDPDLVRKASSAKWLRLSERDRQVIRGVVAGRSNDEIGVDLGISRKTVEAHVSKLLLRFGVGSRVELAARAEREEWLERAESPVERSNPPPMSQP
ncbi:MAG TPA: response regulator transcription factor [Candidatus Limnocylindrales bacterium]|nr:response regulator transcription factor [Candidatus Limnocylindrales bacterium]